VKGGTERRKKFYEKIKSVCEDYYGKKRHKIGIYPDDRAVMSFKGHHYTASFDSLTRLMHNRTDVVFVEKQGTVMKMMPFAEKVGVAFIDSQGFGSEYGVPLAMLCDHQVRAAKDYTDGYVSKYKGNLASLTDCDASGINIGLKVNGAVRIGIDLNTIKEVKTVNLGLSLDLKIEEPQESIDTSKNTHFKALVGLTYLNGKLYESLLEQPNGWEIATQARNYLLRKYTFINENGDEVEIPFIEWLEN
jgi:hypothetical protein